MNEPVRNTEELPAVGSPVERGVGRPAPERRDGRLLELAADAAGLRVLSWLQDGYPFVEDWGGRKYAWNPLVFDSDALRLAVQLDMCLGIAPHRVAIDKISLALAPGGAEVSVKHNGDPYAATRRAIVMAAAAMAERKTPNVF